MISHMLVASADVDTVALALARWQFGLTTLYHYLFVPLTLGLSFLVALLQTAWVRTGKIKYLKLTKLFGKIFLINFAMGVVTGIVQEFQFGMNWSTYSRFVGDIFGAPLAMEGLFAFFLEATFIGLWIFGWNRLSKRAHLATIWLTSAATWMSAFFILAANAFMQNPVGFSYNAETFRAELTDILAVVTNPIALNAFPHTISGGVMFGGAVIVAVAAYHLSRRQHVDEMLTAVKFGAWSVIGGFAAAVISGDTLGKAMVQAQPMKMAAAEALYSTEAPASFSIFTLGTPDGTTELFSIKIPYLLSWLSTGSFTAQVDGINDLQAQYTELYCQTGSSTGVDLALTCPTDGVFSPVIWITYWSFRWMIFFGGLAALVAVVGLWLTRRKVDYTTVKPWAWKVAIWTPWLPLAASLVGWVFTEMGRQPWIVFGLLTTESAVSPGVPSWAVALSLVLFTAIYGVLAVVEFKLTVKAAKAGPPPIETTATTHGTDDVDPEQLAVTY